MDFGVARDQLVFALPLGVAGILAGLSLSIDRLIVSSLASVEDYGVYVNGAFELPVVAMVTGAITAVILPEMASAAMRGDYHAAFMLWRRVSVKSAAVLFPLVALFMVIAEPVMTLLYSEKYAASSIPFRYYLLMLPARIVVFGALFQAIGRTREILFNAVVALVANGVLVWLAVRLLGPMHAAFGAVAGIYLVMLPHVFWRIERYLHVGLSDMLPWSQLALIAFIALSAGGVASGCAVWVSAPVLKVVLAGMVFVGVHLAALIAVAPYRVVVRKLATALGMGRVFGRIFGESDG